MPEAPLVFLSHSGADTAVARELAARLRAAGLRVWIDVEQQRPGDAWMEGLEKALLEADAFALYVGAGGVAGWVDREVRLALLRCAREPRFRIIPILGAGADLGMLPLFLSLHQALDLRQGLGEAGALKALVDAILGERSEPAALLPADTPPYRGLLPFDSEAAYLFFGRDRQTQELVRRVRQERFLAVVGRSGCGKSSLVKAGLVPALGRGRFSDAPSWTEKWRAALLRPGDDPFRELLDALPDLADAASPSERIRVRAACSESLERGVDGLRDCIAGLVPKGTRTLLVVDQFEELFTLGVPAPERGPFIDALLAASAASGDRPVHVVIAVRADFYDQCFEHQGLARQLAASQYAVPRLDKPSLREVIEKPLALAGVEFEPGLVEALLDGVGEEPGDLPLLEHALLLLWEDRSGGRLTHGAYERMGRLQGALTHHAERVYSQLAPEEQGLARRIFLRLTQSGESRRATGRRASKQELLSLGGDPVPVDRVLRRLTAERLLVAGGQAPESGSSSVELAHEAMIASWGRLRGWLDEDRDSLRFLQRLRRDAEEWESSGRNPDFLYRGSRVRDAAGWAEANPRDVTSQLRAFLDASTALRDRSVRRSRALMAVALLVAAFITVFALQQRQREAVLRRQAEVRLGEAEARELAADAMRALEHQQVRQALELATRSARRAPVFEAEDALRHVLRAQHFHQWFALPPRGGSIVGLTDDGGRLVDESDFVVRLQADDPCNGEFRYESLRAAFAGGRVVTEDPLRNVRLRDPARRLDLLLRSGEDHSGFSQVALSPDGTKAAWARAIRGESAVEERVTVWATGSGEALAAPPGFDQPLTGHDCPPGFRHLSFSPDGGSLLTLSFHGPPRVWALEAGTAPVTLGLEPASWAALDATARRALTAGLDGGVRLWEVAGAVPIADLAGHAGRVRQVAWMPDQERALSAGDDGTVRIWDLVQRRAVGVLSGHRGAVTGAGISLDGSTIVTTGEDRTARIWDARTGEQRALLPSDRGGVTHADVSPFGRWALTVGGDETVGLWELATGGRVLEHPLEGSSRRAPAGLLAAGFDLPGRVVTAGRDGTVRIWSWGVGHEAAVLEQGRGRVRHARFDPRGERLLTAGEDGSIWLWDVGTGRPIEALEGGPAGLAQLAFTADGAEVAAVGRDGELRIWHSGTGRRRHGAQAPGEVFELCPGGDSFAVAGIARDRTPWVLLEDRLHRLAASVARVGRGQRPVLSPDCGRLAVWSEHGGVVLWEVATNRRSQLRMGDAPAYLRFSPSGGRLLAGSSDGAVRVYDAVSGQPQVSVDGDRARALEAAFSPDDRWFLTVGADHNLRLWDTASGAEHAVLRGHSGRIHAASFDARGERLISASEDGTARLWDVGSGQLTSVLRGHDAPVTWAAISPPGNRALTVTADGQVRLFATALDDLLELAEARIAPEPTAADGLSQSRPENGVR